MISATSICQDGTSVGTTEPDLNPMNSLSSTEDDSFCDQNFCDQNYFDQNTVPKILREILSNQTRSDRIYFIAKAILGVLFGLLMLLFVCVCFPIFVLTSCTSIAVSATRVCITLINRWIIERCTGEGWTNKMLQSPRIIRANTYSDKKPS